MRTPSLVVALAAMTLALPTPLHAHGGQYTGPGDTVPPGGGRSGNGPPSGGPTQPTSPDGTPGRTGVPGHLGPPGVGRRDDPTTGGLDLGADHTSWKFWWGFNKHRYLQLKAHLHDNGPDSGSRGFFAGPGMRETPRDLLRPTTTQIEKEIVPALTVTLAASSNPDIVTACLIALAKIGEARDEAGRGDLGALIQPWLASKNQEIRETAAVSLGILASDLSIEPLLALVRDTAAGRALVGQREVDPRTRSFAAYGLSLVGAATGDEEARMRIVDELIETLRTDTTRSRDLSVACVIALGLVPLAHPGDVSELDAKRPEAKRKGSPGEEPGRFTTRAQTIAYLVDYLGDDTHDHLVRAHVPVACARLLAGLPAGLAKDLEERITRDLVARVTGRVRAEREVVQGSILALGLLGDLDLDPADVAVRAALREVPDKHADLQAQYFARMALASVAGRPGDGDDPRAGYDELVADLLRGFAKAKGDKKAWNALALGVLGHTLAGTQDVSTESALGQALRSALGEKPSGDRVGAYSIAAGLLRDVEAVPPLLAHLERLHDDEARGYVTVGLGLIGDRRAIEPITRVLEESLYRTELLRQAAIGLGLLGDKQLAESLAGWLEEATSLATHASLAMAVGFIGDRRSVEPLVNMLHDEELTDLGRAFAAAALGIVADKEPVPWNAKIGEDLNYRAATPTLNDPSGKGILNLL